MYGLGVLKGLGITFKHFINTFVDDLKYFPHGSTLNKEAFAKRQGPASDGGLFTVEYPEQKLNLPENFRFIPFLVTDYDVARDAEDYNWDEATGQNRCTSCGICPKVCPPQCIWVVRTNDPDTGKPIPQPAEFYIDTDVCMNCGLCAEFCPFDAIKMDNDFELADYDREVDHIHDLERLLKPVSYYASIRPTWNAQEEESRRLAEEEKQRKEEEKARKKAEKEAAKAKAAAEKAAAEAAAGEKAAAEAKVAQVAAAAAVSATPDDLTKLEGIGPKISSILNDAGITTYAQLASTKIDSLKEILQNTQLRVPHDPTTWPEQAYLANEGKWDELEKLQDELHGGRRVEK